jgi:hypothetical protein
MGDWLLGIVLIGETTGEDHIGGYSIALGETVDILVRFGGVHVVDTQIQRRTDFELRQYAQRRHATRSIHQRSQSAAVDDSGLWITDDLRAVRQDDREAIIAGAVHLHAENLAMAQCREKSRRTLKNGVFGHLINTLVRVDFE